MSLQTGAKAASRGKCFVLSPIGPDGSEIREHADEVFKHIIQPAMELCELEAKRSDHLSAPGKISEQMFTHIVRDDVCIAILTGHNPNVFYELAIAHSVRRPVIIMIQKGQVLPFDVKDLRCISYDFLPSNIKSDVHVKALAGQINELRASDWKVPAISRELEWFGEDGSRSPKPTHSPRLYSIIGLTGDEPVVSNVFQRFRFDANDNPNPVANLWADPRIGNYVNANIAESEEEPSLTVRFRSEKDSFPPAVSIHPQGLIARRVPGDCKKLTFKARTVSKETSKDPATMTMRVVNGHAEHWSYLDQKTGGLKKFRLGPILERFELDLSDPSRWRSFSGAGYRPSTVTNADLSVITSVVFELGCGGNPRELGHGEGVVQIFEIGFE